MADPSRGGAAPRPFGFGPPHPPGYWGPQYPAPPEGGYPISRNYSVPAALPSYLPPLPQPFRAAPNVSRADLSVSRGIACCVLARCKTSAMFSHSRLFRQDPRLAYGQYPQQWADGAGWNWTRQPPAPLERSQQQPQHTHRRPQPQSFGARKPRRHGGHYERSDDDDESEAGTSTVSRGRRGGSAETRRHERHADEARAARSEDEGGHRHHKQPRKLPPLRQRDSADRGDGQRRDRFADPKRAGRRRVWEPIETRPPLSDGSESAAGGSHEGRPASRDGGTATSDQESSEYDGTESDLGDADPTTSTGRGQGSSGRKGGGRHCPGCSCRHRGTAADGGVRLDRHVLQQLQLATALGLGVGTAPVAGVGLAPLQALGLSVLVNGGGTLGRDAFEGHPHRSGRGHRHGREHGEERRGGIHNSNRKKKTETGKTGSDDSSERGRNAAGSTPPAPRADEKLESAAVAVQRWFRAARAARPFRSRARELAHRQRQMAEELRRMRPRQDQKDAREALATAMAASIVDEVCRDQASSVLHEFLSEEARLLCGPRQAPSDYSELVADQLVAEAVDATAREVVYEALDELVDDYFQEQERESAFLGLLRGEIEDVARDSLSSPSHTPEDDGGTLSSSPSVPTKLDPPSPDTASTSESPAVRPTTPRASTKTGIADGDCGLHDNRNGPESGTIGQDSERGGGGGPLSRLDSAGSNKNSMGNV